MLYLALDTSTTTAGLALIDNGNILSQQIWNCGQNHSVEILPRLDTMLNSLNIESRRLQGIITALGPGSFNGLRVGLGTAKGLAYSLDIPIAGISTLEAEAYRYAFNPLPICAMINAGRNEIAAAVYQLKDGKWNQITLEHIDTIDGLCNAICVPTLFCGEIETANLNKFKQRLKYNAVIPNPSEQPRVVSLAILGEKRLISGEASDLASMQPIYMRRPNITRPKKPQIITGINKI
jgi:tRNA threonylcarbamoyl adenosine modification protein YeaZ